MEDTITLRIHNIKSYKLLYEQFKHSSEKIKSCEYNGLTESASYCLRPVHQAEEARDSFTEVALVFENEQPKEGLAL